MRLKIFAFVSVAALSIGMLSAAHAGDTLDRIKASKTINIGYRDSSIPFSYLGENHKPIGFSLDLCNAIIQKLDSDLGEKLKVNLVLVNSSNRIPLVENGTIDLVCGGASSSKKRLEQVSFSDTTFISSPAWLVEKSSHLSSPLALKGKTIVVTQGSNAVGIAHRISKDENLNLNIIEAKDHAESFMMVNTGRAAAFLEDNILLAGLKAQDANPSSLEILPQKYAATPYGLIFAKNNPKFGHIVNGVLSGMMASGAFTKIYDKWFMEPIPPRGINLNFPISPALQDRITHPSAALLNN